MSTKKAKAAPVVAPSESESAMDVVAPVTTEHVVVPKKKATAKSVPNPTGVLVTLDKNGDIHVVIDQDAAIFKLPEMAIKRLTRRALIPRYGKNPGTEGKKDKKKDGDNNKKKKKGEPKIPRAIVQWIRHYIVDVTRAVFGAAGHVTENGHRKTINDGDLQYAYHSLGLGTGKVAYGDQQNAKRPVRTKKAGGEVGVVEGTPAKLVKPSTTPKGIAAAKNLKKKVAAGTKKSSATAKA